MFGAGHFSGRFAVPPGLYASDGRRPDADQAISATILTMGKERRWRCPTVAK